jgi:hypothetical protein
MILLSSATVRSELETLNLYERIQELKDKWHAYLLRLDTSKISRRILMYKPACHRDTGCCRTVMRNRCSAAHRCATEAI